MERKGYILKGYLTGSALMATVVVGLIGAGQAEASLIIGVGSTTVAAGGSGFVDITLQNTSSTPFATPIDGFSAVFSSSNAFVSFTGATMATTAPYIFANNSGDVNLSVPFYGTSPEPNIADFAFPGAATTIAGNGILGLGRIFFSVGAGASAGTAPITLTTNGTTSLTDSNGATIVSTLSNGSITITATSTPEPSTFVPLALLLITGVVGRFRRVQ
jgi:hypothetical protein